MYHISWKGLRRLLYKEIPSSETKISMLVELFKQNKSK